MPQCPHCAHDFAVSPGFRCPSCGKDLRAPKGEATPVSTPVSGRPAHLALLEGAPDGPRAPRPRLVSSAGPAVPVLPQQQNDSVPNGWMARLEAARVAASPAPPAGAPASPPPRAAPNKRPPPLKVGPSSDLSGKPAHLLVAQLEAEEQKRKNQDLQRIAELPADDRADEIAHVRLDLPTEPAKKKRIPDWVVMALLGLLVVGGLASAYFVVKKEPAPTAELDPKLVAAAERRKVAIAALEEGHTRALEGKKSADLAIAAYQKALELEPTMARAERGLAIAYTTKDDKSQAVSHYKRYLELEPNANDAEEVRAIIEQYEKANAGSKR